jgi:HlyD family type I secretion membrane fusion protein
MSDTSPSADPSRTDRYADPARPARIGLLVILAFLLCLTAWGSLAPVSGAAIADGNLQVESQRQAVQHPYGGVVARLLVKEGEIVAKGQILMTLTESDPRAKLDVLLAERDSLMAQEARLIAERDGQQDLKLPSGLTERKDTPIVVQSMANERAIMAARARQNETEASMLRQKTAQLREQIVGFRAQIEALDRQRALLDEETQGARQLLASGYTPKTRVLALDRGMAKLDSDKGAKTSEVAAAEQEIGTTELALARLDRQRITEISDQLRTTQSRLAELKPRIDAAQDVVDRTRVAAPTSGAVVGLSVFTEGGVIQPGAKVLDIIPLDNPLIVEARLQLHDVNEVKAGQQADVRLTGIPWSERPRMRGEVMTVSADKLTDQQSGRGYFSLRIRPDASDLKNIRLALQPGMPAQVIVTTRPRTFASYIFGPLLDEITGAFREK